MYNELSHEKCKWLPPASSSMNMPAICASFASTLIMTIAYAITMTTIISVLTNTHFPGVIQ